MTDETVEELFGFGGKTPKPCSKRAMNLAMAMTKFLAADAALLAAVKNAPDYTGQWDRKDYYAMEQEAWFRACEALERAVLAVGEGT